MSERMFAIRSSELDSEEDRDPKHPHLYWISDFGWGYYNGATVFPESGLAKSYRDETGELRPYMLGLECFWEEVPIEYVGQADREDEHGTWTEPCGDIKKDEG